MRTNAILRSILMLACLARPGSAQPGVDVVARGKASTALVGAFSREGAATGSAFCIDKAGLFLTNAHVVAGVEVGAEGQIRLVVDIGSRNQKDLPAKVYRIDHEVDLALLKVNPVAGLVPLELGRDADLAETAEVTTFGFPFGLAPAVGRFPDISVNRSRITSLKRKDDGALQVLQFDGQINPGNSGGPVLDSQGRVVGVAWATIRGAAMNFAIPVGLVAGFLEAPGLIVIPPPLAYIDRSRPAPWSIKVQPARPLARLPEGLAVTVTVADGVGPPRPYTAQSLGNGSYKVAVIPVPRDPDRQVELVARFGTDTIRLQVKDGDVRVGGRKVMASDLSFLQGGLSPHAYTLRGQMIQGPITGLGKAKISVGNKTRTVYLADANRIDVRVLDPPAPVGSIEAVVQAKEGAKVLATVRLRAALPGSPGSPRPAPVAPAPVAEAPRPRPAAPPGPADEGLVKVEGELDVDATPLGAGRWIRPPGVAIGPARIGPSPSGVAPARAVATPATAVPLTRQLDGRITDVAVGGGGRYLLLTLRDARKLLVFDVNKADFIKTITLPSENVLVAAGARKFLIAYPDERLIQRWDLETLLRDGDSRASPIGGKMRNLALGSDSDGPALAAWSLPSENRTSDTLRFSFIDLERLMVLRIPTGPPGLSASVSGGSFTWGDVSEEEIVLRASAGGSLYAVWRARISPSGFQSLSVDGKRLKVTSHHESFGHLVPGPDGRTIFTGYVGRVGRDGKPPGQSKLRTMQGNEMLIPTPDPAYYLSVPRASTPASPTGSTAAAVHLVGDGDRLLTVQGLDEMANAAGNRPWEDGNLTIEKRYHFVPAADLLITIPRSDDRLILRRLDVDDALGRMSEPYLFVTSATDLALRAGGSIDHQVEARSKRGRVTFSLLRGPDGMSVSPDGKLTWTAPGSHATGEETAVIVARDNSGLERFRTLTIHVE